MCLAQWFELDGSAADERSVSHKMLSVEILTGDESMILGADSNVYVGERRCLKELCSTLATYIVR